MADSSAAVRPFDARATVAVRRRLAKAATPPWLHVETARRMGERLEVIRTKPDTILDWWSFLGAGGEVLARRYPDARRIAVEPDAVAVERTRRSVAAPWWSPRGWGRSAPPVILESEDIPRGAQLIWANMVVHAAADPPALFERWEQLLGADGFIMFSALGPGTLRELRSLYAHLGWGPPAADFVDMHDLGDMLVRAGFADPVMDQETLDLRWIDVKALLADLRRLGGNTHPGRFRGLRTPRWERRLEHELAGWRDAQGGISLAVEVAYGHAFKAAPRVRADRPTTVSLDEMRAMVRSGKPRPPR